MVDFNDKIGFIHHTGKFVVKPVFNDINLLNNSVDANGNEQLIFVAPKGNKFVTIIIRSCNGKVLQRIEE